MIGDWANFVFFKVLPTASGQILLWLNEWQTLTVGVLVLVAGTIWTRATLRSNQRLAYLVTQSLKIMTEAFAESSRDLTGTSGRHLATSASRETQEHELEFRLDRLRGIIRGALSVIPQTNQRVDPNVAMLLRNIAGFSLEGAAAPKGMTEPQRRAMSELQRCISGLKSAPIESMKCADAWDSLVRLHRAARVLRDMTVEEPREQAA